jgi:hypothetical protein
MGDGAPVGSQLTEPTPEYLLLLRNSKVLSPKQRNEQKQLQDTSIPSEHPIFMDSFPKLKLWYRQHQACPASTLFFLNGKRWLYRHFIKKKGTVIYSAELQV